MGRTGKEEEEGDGQLHHGHHVVLYLLCVALCVVSVGFAGKHKVPRYIEISGVETSSEAWKNAIAR